MLSVLASILLSIQPPISVKVSNVNNNTPIEKVGDRPVVFGIKETTNQSATKCDFSHFSHRVSFVVDNR